MPRQKQTQEQKVVVHIHDKAKTKKPRKKRTKKPALPPAQPVILGLGKVPPIVYEFNAPAPPVQISKPAVQAPLGIPEGLKTPITEKPSQRIKEVKERLAKARYTRKRIMDKTPSSAEHLSTPLPQQLFKSPEEPDIQLRSYSSEEPRRRGRTPKYETPEERIAAQRRQQREHYQRKKTERETGLATATAHPVPFAEIPTGTGFSSS